MHLHTHAHTHTSTEYVTFMAQAWERMEENFSNILITINAFYKMCIFLLIFMSEF